MRPTPSRLFFLPLAAVLGTGCLVLDSGPNTPSDPCSPNPCTQGDKTQCVNEDGNARCLCKPGTVLRPSGVCEPLSAANCPEHTGDFAEPDDCLSRAAALTADTSSRQQSIEPIGDYDFFRVDGTLNTVYSVTVEPGQGSLMPRVDVFDKEGLPVASQDGRPKAQVGFKARASGPYYVRVSHSPVDPSPATGLYSLGYSALGQDDYADGTTDAKVLVPDVGGTNTPTNISGRLEYGQDVDWFAISVTLGSTYRIEFNTDYNVPTLAAYTTQDVKNPFLTVRKSYVEIKADATTTLYLALFSAQGESGGYVFRVYRY